ncbi:UbiD family decarboxylase [Halanaeroarchaeum sulfurireducens]|uniref:Anhydromevalonate phosphate decarboxylase n=1 Tax=Halanaeroarchaeum sulfurireducens TaxID=1604004 RepID=A0A0N9N9L7_9EURY|nr:UbiD family decarboxylase [Halanaeroarchaeum sulfurireducens]ALG81725.1 UbiD family decarboxylase [Halanaeroarchaeum sulfurireducens]
MGLRQLLADRGDATVLTESVDPRFELPALAAADESAPMVFEEVAGYPDVRGVSNLVSTRDLLADALGVERDGVIGAMSAAMDQPRALDDSVSPRFDAVVTDPDLDEHIPIPVFYDEHERQYFASSIVAVEDPETGVGNLSFHRMMYDGGDELVVRMVERHLHDIYSRTDGPLEVAIVMGVHPAVELAAATSFSPEMSELEMANALLDGDLAVTEIDGIRVPADAEVVLRATITKERREEGPFVDLSRTWDRTREQPVVSVSDLYMREDPYVRIIVPGRTEHAHLMGVPQEPRIYTIVENTIPTVQSVVLTPGGCSWLHGVVQIDKRQAGDPKYAGMAALAGHPSMKKVTVVDADVDPADPQQVEWAEATRMQPDRDITTIEHAKGSSLDPSQDYETGVLTKWIVDATIPADRDPADFREVPVPEADEIDVDDYR